MSKIAIMTICYDPYDHNSEVSSEIHHRDMDDPQGRELYVSHCVNVCAKASTGWATLISLDTVSGVSELVFSKINPLRHRVELNVKAKEARIKVVKRIASTMHQILNEHLSFAPATNPCFASASFVGTTSPDVTVNDDVDEEEEESSF